MTNKLTHQNHALVFSSQSYTAIVQILPTSGSAATASRTNNHHPAGQLRSHPLEDASVISRVSARLPATSTGERPRRPTHTDTRATDNIRTRHDSASTHNRLSGSKAGRASHARKGVTLLQFTLRNKTESRANTTRTNTAANSHPSGHTTGEHTPIEPSNSRKASLIGKTALTQWVHQSLHDKHEDTLYPTIRSLVRRENRTLGNRLVFFQMRTAFASEQTRILTTNILSRFLKHLGIPDEIFNNLVDQSNKMAKRNIIARNPDFKSLIEEWWQTEPEETADEKANETPTHKRQVTKPYRKEKRLD